MTTSIVVSWLDGVMYVYWNIRLSEYRLRLGQRPMLSSTLAREICEMEADLCSAFSDPNRILILYALNEKPLNVSEITAELEIPQSTTSRHLKILRDRGLVMSSRQGTSVEYRLSDPRLIDALDVLRSVLRDRIARRANLMDVADA